MADADAGPFAESGTWRKMLVTTTMAGVIGSVFAKSMFPKNVADSSHVAYNVGIP
jgi:hypothetical protein